jgi:hypothetical protein
MNRPETKPVLPTVAALSEFVAAAIDQARYGEKPFNHLVFENVFPAGFYDQLLAAMPESNRYRAMSGRTKHTRTDAATPTRIKVDLFPEYIRNMAPDKRDIWNLVGRVMCSRQVKEAFMRRFEQPLQMRFGAKGRTVGMFPIPMLMRDTAGYRIKPHTDTHWKGITVQFYLPRDKSISHVGTVFHDILADGSRPKHSAMQFVPNSGYAFAVGDDTWHSVDLVGPEVKTRDSILLTYFVDDGALRILRNRGKRIGNFLLNEYRNLTGK